jgi:putative nucleotidyltransferase with HDIG domain
VQKITEKKSSKALNFFLKCLDDALMKFCKPSELIKILLNWSDISILEPIKRLKTCEQNKEHHPEGNVLNHTMLVIDKAAKYRDMIDPQWKREFMWAMLLHDIGKPDTTHPEKLTAYGHDIVGAKLARGILLEFDTMAFTERVCSIIRVHMRPKTLIKQNSTKNAWKRLQSICRLDVLAYVIIADSDGRGFPPKNKENKYFEKTMEMHNKLLEESIR